MENDFSREFFFFLDSAKSNKLFVKFVHKSNSSELEELVIIYLTKIEDTFLEVVKYDFSKKEKFHVHYFAEDRKVYLDEVPNNETLDRVFQHLCDNWQKYYLRFIEK